MDGPENIMGFPGGTNNAGDASLIPGLGRAPEVGNHTPLLYSGLGNPLMGYSS